MKYRKYSTNNSDVPAEAALRAASLEIGKLKSEIAYLESELSKKNEAIAAFKKWQVRSAEYHYQYWLVEGIRLMGKDPMDERTRSLVRLLKQNELLAGRAHTIENTYNNYMKARASFAENFKEEINELQAADEGLAEGSPEGHEGGDI